MLYAQDKFIRLKYKKQYSITIHRSVSLISVVMVVAFAVYPGYIARAQGYSQSIPPEMLLMALPGACGGLLCSPLLYPATCAVVVGLVAALIACIIGGVVALICSIIETICGVCTLPCCCVGVLGFCVGWVYNPAILLLLFISQFISSAVCLGLPFSVITYPCCGPCVGGLEGAIIGPFLPEILKGLSGSGGGMPSINMPEIRMPRF
jgi:hypothetical protein